MKFSGKSVGEAKRSLFSPPRGRDAGAGSIYRAAAAAAVGDANAPFAVGADEVEPLTCGADVGACDGEAGCSSLLNNVEGDVNFFFNPDIVAASRS